MKTVLVTGANKGIGRQVARQLARKGFHVFVGARNREAGRKAAKEITNKGGKATFLEIDVADNASVRAATGEFTKIAGRGRIAIESAAVAQGIARQFGRRRLDRQFQDSDSYSYS